MPIYEYQCTDCNFQCEQIQKINDAHLVKCPSCGKDSMKKLVSAVAFRLKGGGWYETDFKSGKKRNVADRPGGHGEGHKEDYKEGSTTTQGGAAKAKEAKESKDSDTSSTGKVEGTSKPQTQSSKTTPAISNSE